MLGFYQNFPESLHRITRFVASVSNKGLQQTLIQAFYQLGNEKLTIEEITDPSIPQCIVFFEIGIAEANGFNYLDSEEKSRVIKAIRKKPFEIMDFLCSIRYYRMQNEKKTPLRFDYYMLRFVFNKNSIEIRVFHERGPRHVSPEDIVSFLVRRIEAFRRKVIRPL